MAIESIATGLAANGLSACAGILAREFMPSVRIQRTIRAALKETENSDEEDPVSRKFEDDLKFAYATESQLDIHTNNALRSISVSNLLSHLTKCAILQIEPKSALKLASYIYISVGGNGYEEANSFSQKLWRVVRNAANADELGNLVKKDNYFFLKSRKEIDAEIRRVETGIAALVANYVKAERDRIPPDPISPLKVALDQDIESTVFRSIAQNTDNSLNEIDVHGASGDVLRVALDKVYVDVPIRSVERGGSFFDYRETRLQKSRQSRIGWINFLSKVNRTVLLGDPGGGKSTLAKKICVETARSAQSGGIVLPLLVQLRSYAAAKTKDPTTTLIRFICDSVSAYLPDVQPDDLMSLLHYFLSVGRCLVVFDGLDEVLIVGNRAIITKEVDQFCARYPLSDFLITSRFVGYESTSLPDFDHFAVADLDDDSINELFQKVSVSVLKKTRTTVERELDDFLGDAQRKASELLSNPLLLTLIIIIYSKKREIPDNRSDLYSACAELLFDRWDSYRNIRPHLPERYRLYALLMFLSSILLDREELGGRISRSELEKEAKVFFLDDYVDNREGRAAEAANLLVDHLTGRAWILHEVGESVFEFTHRTFLEFFYSKYLDARYEKVEELIDAMGGWISDGSRSLPSHLALQLKVKDKRRIATTAALSLGQLLEGGGSPNSIGFAADSLSYLLPSAEGLRKFVSIIMEKSIAKTMSSPIIECLQCKSPQKEIICDEVVDRICKLDSVSDIREFNRLFENIAIVHDHIKNGLVFRLIRDRYIPVVYGLQKRSPFVTKLIFDIAGAPDWSIVKLQGTRLWAHSGASNRDRRYDFRTFDSRMMLRELIQLDEGVASLAGAPYARLALEVFDDDALGKKPVRGGVYRPQLTGAELEERSIVFSDIRIRKSFILVGMFYCECSRRAYSGGKDDVIFELVRSSYSGMENVDENFCNIVRRWVRGELSFFDPIRVHFRREELFGTG